MDKLKNFIETHKDDFEDDLLPDGHFERFENKLPPSRKQPSRWIGFFAMAVAAAVALFVFLKIQSEIGDAPVQQTSAYTCETQKEIDELRVFYNMQMNEMYTQIRALYKIDQTPGGLELLEETKRVIKTSQDFEDNILPDLPCSDAGLFAMNQHYKTSLKSLDIMLKQMEYVIDNDITSKYTN